jgi:cation transport ATPase
MIGKTARFNGYKVTPKGNLMSNEEKEEVPMSSTLFHPETTGQSYQFVTYQVCPDSHQMETDFLYMLASLEAENNHPMAVQILEVAKKNNILPVSVTAFQRFQDGGAGGLITLPKDQRPRAAIIGSHAFVLKSQLQIPDLLETTLKTWEAEPDTIVLLGGWDGWVRGLVKFRVSSLH